MLKKSRAAILFCIAGMFSNTLFSLTLSDITSKTSINGYMPQDIHISTLTQAFCTGFSFCIQSGKIWVKTDDSNQWELFLGTGLPFYKGTKALAGDKWFDSPQAICEIACDDDTLMAFDTNGALYRCYIKETTPEKAFVWTNGFGWPAKDTFYQIPSIANKRAWAMGVRRQSVLYHEDIFGNQHHYGTMGLETLYFLLANGQEIRFTDSGLPTDVSRSILGPERGSFIAQNMSVSADTLFLIDNAGTMYTRLIDFDTMGADPMWFKYTYKPYKQPFSGNDYLSNYTEWGLPNEDWYRQPSIPLTGKARLTRFITISQNGQGNYARELRVAGLSPNGDIGYYHKSLLGKEWYFTKAHLFLSDTDFLAGAEAAPDTLRGKTTEYSYTGHVLKNGQPILGITCSIPDFTLTTEGSCTVHFDSQTGHAEIPLYLLEIWTYITRNKPGFDGTPNNFFATPSYDEQQLHTEDVQLNEILTTLFGDKNNEIYSMTAEATDNYVQIASTKKDTVYELFLTKHSSSLTPDFYKIISIYNQPLLQLYSDDSLVLSPTKEYTIEDADEIQKKITANYHYIQSLHDEMEAFKKYYHGAFVLRWGFKTIDVVTTLTLINKIVDFPKIKTLTQFGTTILQKNAEKYRNLLTFQTMTYPYLLELVEKRISFYQDLLVTLVQKQQPAYIDSHLQPNYTAYIQQAGLHTLYKGYSVSAKCTATLSQLSLLPLYPAYELTLTKNEIKQVIRVELPTILDTVNNTSNEQLSLDAVFTVMDKQKNNQIVDIKKLESKLGTLTKQGDTIQLWVQDGKKQKLLFESPATAMVDTPKKGD